MAPRACGFAYPTDVRACDPEDPWICEEASRGLFAKILLHVGLDPLVDDAIELIIGVNSRVHLHLARAAQAGLANILHEDRRRSVRTVSHPIARGLASKLRSGPNTGTVFAFVIFERIRAGRVRPKPLRPLGMTGFVEDHHQASNLRVLELNVVVGDPHLCGVLIRRHARYGVGATAIVQAKAFDPSFKKPVVGFSVHCLAENLLVHQGGFFSLDAGDEL